LSRVLKSMYTVEEGTAQIPVSEIVFSVEEDADLLSPEESVQRADFLLHEATERAAAIVKRAEAEKQALLADAERELNQLREQTYTAAFQEGFSSGMEQAEQEQEAVLREKAAVAEKLINDAKSQFDSSLLALPGVVAAVVRTALQTLLQRELTTQPADIEKLVREMLEFVVEQSSVEVRVSLDEFDHVSQQLSRRGASGYGEWQLKVVPDVDVAPGGCVLKTPNGRADARIETRVELVEAELTRIIERGLAHELAASSPATA